MSLTDLVSDYHAARGNGRQWPRYGGGFHDRSTTLGASDVPACLRMTGYAKHPDWAGEGTAQDWGFANRGHAVEAFISAAIRDGMEGKEKFRFSGRNQVTFVHPTLPLSATPDGLYQFGKDYTVYTEIKSIDPRTNVANLPREDHLMQTKVGMEVVAAHAPELTPSHAILIYVDASSLAVVREVKVEREPDMLEAAAHRADLVFNAADPKALRAEGVMDRQCRYCAFKTVCEPYAALPGTHAAPHPSAVENDDVLGGIALRLLEIKAMEAEEDMLKAQVKTIMAARGGATDAAGEGWALTVQQREGAFRLDSKKVRELADRTQTKWETLGNKGAPSTVLTVKPV